MQPSGTLVIGSYFTIVLLETNILVMIIYDFTFLQNCLNATSSVFVFRQSPLTFQKTILLVPERDITLAIERR